MTDNSVILFDGICNLCNKYVQYVIKHDKQKVFRFAALQSDAGQAILKEHHLSSTDFNSFILLQNNIVYTKSTAALKVAKQLNGIVKILYGFIIVPKFIRNGVYNFIAKNRYRWFGKKESCMIPTSNIQSRFLK